MVLSWPYGKKLNGDLALQWSHINYDKKTIYILWNWKKANTAKDSFGASDPRQSIILELEVADV